MTVAPLMCELLFDLLAFLRKHNRPQLSRYATLLWVCVCVCSAVYVYVVQWDAGAEWRAAGLVRDVPGLEHCPG
ncbi:hypothetical protein EON63_12405, partial [archaeon]